MTPDVLGAIVFDFDPVLRFGDLAVRWETLGIAGAAFVGLVVAALVAGRTPAGEWLIGEAEEALTTAPNGQPAEEFDRPWHLRRDDLLFVALGAVPGAVVLGRVGHGLLHADFYAGDWRALLDPATGSLELTLGVVGGTLTAIYVAALLDAPVGRWLHAGIGPLLLVLGFGVAARALGGSGQGTASGITWATTYLPPGPWGSAAAEIPAHPAQLYEALVTGLVLLAVAFLARFTTLRRADGRLFGIGIGLWALGRAVVAATWRDPDVAWILNAEQLIALAVAAVALGATVAASAMRARNRPGTAELPIIP